MLNKTKKFAEKKLKPLKETRFSIIHLLAFALVFGVVGSYILIRSFAASPSGQIRKSDIQLVKDQTMQLVSQAKQIKGAHDNNGIENFKLLAKNRKPGVLQLMQDNPDSFLHIYAPPSLASNLPNSARNDLEHPQQITGTLSVLHQDGIDTSKHVLTDAGIQSYVIDQKGKKHTVVFTNEDKAIEMAGDTVSLNGVELDSTIVVDNDAKDNAKVVTTASRSPLIKSKVVSAENTSPPVLGAATTNKRVAVILISFANATEQPYTAAQAKSWMFDQLPNRSANAYYMASSRGQFGLTGDVLGWYQLKDQVQGTCDFQKWGDDADAAAAAAGVNLGNYDNIMYAWAANACSFSGTSFVGGIRSYINDGYIVYEDVTAHELGHNFNLSHAHSFVCKDNNSNYVPISGDCTKQEYGDSYDVMGGGGMGGRAITDTNATYGPGEFNNYDQAELGFISQSSIQTVNSSGTYSMGVLENGSGPVSGIRIAKDYDSSGNPINYYYLEYRRSQTGPYDNLDLIKPWETSVINGYTYSVSFDGVFVRSGANYDGSGSNAIVMDVNTGPYADPTLYPSHPYFTNWNNDPTLKTGSTFNDAARGIAITTQAISSTSAAVQVNITPVTCVRARPTVSISPTSQWGNPGNSLSYSINVANNDRYDCPVSTFNVSSDLPNGFSQSGSPGQLSLAPGASTSFNFQVTSPASSASGYNTLSETIDQAAAPGTYTQSVTANYNVNDTSDQVPPAVAILQPANGATIGGFQVNLYASASDNTGIDHVNFSADGIPLTQATYDPTAYFNNQFGAYLSAIYSSYWPNGNHTIIAKAYDPNGNSSSSQIIVNSQNTNNTDNNPPQGTWITPTVNSTVKGNATLSANIWDYWGVKSVQFYVRSGCCNVSPIGNAVSNPNPVLNNNYSVNWDTTKLADGPYVISAEGTDAAGHSGGAPSININVNNSGSVGDTQPPVVSITSPASGASVSGPLAITANASDNVAIAKVDFFIDGTLAFSSSASPYSFSWNSTTVANGSHVLTANAYDTSNNSSSASAAFNVSNGDTTPPSTPAGLSVASSTYSQVNLSWNPSSDNVGVAGYYIVRNGTTIAQTTGTASAYSDTAVNASSSYTYQVMAYDAKNNTSAPSNTASVTTPAAPDTAPPSQPSNLSAAAVSSSQINLSWSPSSDNIGVTSYDVYRNSTKLTSLLVASVCNTPTSCSFGDSGLTAATNYSYFVIARDAANNSSPQSNIASATTQSSPTVLTGSISGTTYSSRGGTLAGVSITTRYGGSNHSFSSSASGNYFIPSLPPAAYSLKYSKSGFNSLSQSANVTSNTTTTANATLVSRK